MVDLSVYTNHRMGDMYYNRYLLFNTSILVGSWVDCKASHLRPLPMFFNTLIIVIVTIVLNYTDHRINILVSRPRPTKLVIPCV